MTLGRLPELTTGALDGVGRHTAALDRLDQRAGAEYASGARIFTGTPA